MVCNRSDDTIVEPVRLDVRGLKEKDTQRPILPGVLYKNVF